MQQIDGLLQQRRGDHLECLGRLAQLARLVRLMEVVMMMLRHDVIDGGLG